LGAGYWALPVFSGWGEADWVAGESGKEANPDFFSGEQLYQLLEDKHGILQRVLKEARPAREILAELVAKGEMTAPVPLAEALRGVPEVSLAGLTDLATAPVEWAFRHRDGPADGHGHRDQRDRSLRQRQADAPER